MEKRCYGCMKIKDPQPVCQHCGYDERSRNNIHQLPVGTLLGGQYTVGRVLGQGGFGITYMGWDNILNRAVAVKEFFPASHAGRDTRNSLEVTNYDTGANAAFEDNKRRFLREAEALARLWDIPQIVRVLRHFEENGTAYIAMEYVEGMDLRRYMKNLGRPLSMEELLGILGPVMEALSHVHRAELVHRDISPDNIMVLPDGSAKLLDFGAARYVENADADKDRDTSTQAILKHGFAPPEQYRSHGALGPWTDVYAMCATVYFCLTGKRPPEAMNRVIEEMEVGWENIPGLTKRQTDVLNAGMDLKPQRRIQSVEQLHSELFAEIFEARERARLKAEEEKRRAEEAKRKEQQRLEEEARKAEEARKKEEARQAARLRAKEEKQKKEQARLEAKQRRTEEARKKEEARQEENRRKKQRLEERKEAAEAARTAREQKKAEKTAHGKKKPGKPLLMAAVMAVVLVVAAGMFLRLPAPMTAKTGQTSGSAAEQDGLAWKENKLMYQTGYHDLDFDGWYAANKNNSLYTDTSDGSFLSMELSNGKTVDITDAGYLDYLGSGSVYGSDILKKEIVEVIFLDSIKDAPEDAWDVSLGKKGSVLAWVTSAKNGMYVLSIAADGGVNGLVACKDLFYGFTGLEKIRFNDCFHTEDVQTMRSMFAHCVSLKTLDLGSLDTSNVTVMCDMFAECSGLTKLDVSRRFDTSKVTDMSFMFAGCSSLTKLDVSGFDTSCAIIMDGMFTRCSALRELDLSSFHTSNVNSMREMFNSCSSLTKLDISSFDTANVSDMNNMFAQCEALKGLDVSHFQTGKVLDMTNMFGGCSNLTFVDVSGFDTANVLRMRYMFSSCSRLTGLDVSGFDTSNVRLMTGMFTDCKGLTELDVSHFRTEKVSDMAHMFSGCSGLTELDVSSFDTSGVLDMNAMFYGCSGLTEINVSGFNTGNVTDMSWMFGHCTSLDYLDLMDLDTSSVTNMSYMCYGCTNLQAFVTYFDTAAVKDFSYMFGNCTNLAYVESHILDMYLAGYPNMEGMFQGCLVLEEMGVV